MDAYAAKPLLERFIDSAVSKHTLALVYGRRRIGKSTLLERFARDRTGFYWEASRAEPALQMRRLGEALGVHLGTAPLLFDSWDSALNQLISLKSDEPYPIVLDEFGYLLEADPTIDSLISRLLGPASQRRDPGRGRLILCGSAIALMRTLTTGEAPLRGRASIELVMQPFDYRSALKHLSPDGDLHLAARLHAVIDGVIGYATDMVAHDLPRDLADFPRWIAERVLSPAATLHHEALTLLAEDPTLTAARPTLHHSILGAIANGAVTAGRISSLLKRPVSNLDPTLKRLIAAGFVVRHEDPVRAQRPTYSLGDPFLQFHYAVLEPHSSALRERAALSLWTQRLEHIFDSRVRGPVFEQQARTWVARFSEAETLGGEPDYIGPSSAVIDGQEHELDVLVAQGGDSDAPADRRIIAIGEAKAGEVVSMKHIRRLEAARASFGPRAADARLLLFGSRFSEDFRSTAGRHDVVRIDLKRLYHGA
ncbi:MAG: AAA family ATPase [Gemmatimonadota bacterium]